MPEAKRTDALEMVYAAVSGGLLSASVAMAVIRVFLATGASDPPASGLMALYAAVLGLACAVALMVAGTALPERFSWLGTTLLFSSGFTALWSVVISFSTELQWAGLLAVGTATAMATGIGWWRFGRVGQEPSVENVAEAPAAAGGDPVE
jgi:hypothetical protein